jgi:FkbM family methyltransferase
VKVHPQSLPQASPSSRLSESAQPVGDPVQSNGCVTIGQHPSNEHPANSRRVLRRWYERTRLACHVVRLYRNWPTVFLDRLQLLSSQPVTYELRDGVRLSAQTNTRDRFIINEIFIEQVYTCSRGFAIRDGWVIADVGAHKGFFAVFAATRARDVKVYSFEPCAENFTVLSHNIQRNSPSNITAFNIAVSGEDGEAILYLQRERGQNSLLQRSDAQPIGEAKVATWSLKRALRKAASPINLLKMDMEGMEYDALLSCAAEDLQKVERVALEYHDQWVHTPHHVSELVDFLGSRGFATYLYPQRPILIAENRHLSEAH